MEFPELISGGIQLWKSCIWVRICDRETLGPGRGWVDW